MTQEWRASVTYATPTNIDDDTLSILTLRLPGFGIVSVLGDTMRAEMTVSATTLRQATDAALRGAHEATTAAFGKALEPSHLRILTVEEFVREMANPPEGDLLGIAEIAALLGVSRQRANQLAAREDFPAPVVALRAGPVYSGRLVRIWESQWERRSGGRRTG